MAATPFYFGDGERRLYGVFHHAEKRAPNAPGVLLFNPFGEEAVRAYRIFKNLAERLARAGASVMRFDYYGSGDSDGDCAALDFEGMVRDSLTAHEELEAMSGARRFCWIGLRLGGAVALNAAKQSGLKPAQLVLWDPVLRGADYLGDLREAHIASLARALDLPEARIERETPTDPRQLTEAMGFELSPALRTQLHSFDFDHDGALTDAIHLIGAKDSSTSASLSQRLETASAKPVRRSDISCAWNSSEAMNAFYVPADALDTIVNAVEARA